MARMVRDYRLETRSARERLRVQREPYWRLLERGLYLGYRKLGGGPGAWYLRRRTLGVVAKTYQKQRLATADDFADADGKEVLSYAQAAAAAREVAQELTEGPRTPYTVRQAVAEYLVDYEARGGKALRDTRMTFDAHVLPTFGDRPVEELTTDELRTWQRDLALRPARLRQRRFAPPRYRALPADADPNEREETRRRRRATANRVFAHLRAALNRAFHEGKVRSDLAWRRVRSFPKVDAPRLRFLVSGEAQRLLNAIDDPDFRALVHGGLVTGCRYGELARIRCGDFNHEAHTVLVAVAKSGRSRHVPLTPEGVALFRRLTAGRLRNDLVFRRGSREWRRSEQTRPLVTACHRAKIVPAVSFHGLRHTYGAALAMAGTPLQVIAAALGHADTRLTERWYAHLLPNYVGDTVRANLPRFAQEEPERVAALTPRLQR
jgi:integrase